MEKKIPCPLYFPIFGIISPPLPRNPQITSENLKGAAFPKFLLLPYHFGRRWALFSKDPSWSSRHQSSFPKLIFCLLTKKEKKKPHSHSHIFLNEETFFGGDWWSESERARPADGGNKVTFFLYIQYFPIFSFFFEDTKQGKRGSSSIRHIFPFF